MFVSRDQYVNMAAP